eukprot:6181883-Pleurochrysis_carterae.AAC.1
MDPTQRISAKEALDHDYFWTEPLPAKPHELPKYPPSHEFTAKKKRQQAHARTRVDVHSCSCPCVRKQTFGKRVSTTRSNPFCSLIGRVQSGQSCHRKKATHRVGRERAAFAHALAGRPPCHASVAASQALYRALKTLCARVGCACRMVGRASFTASSRARPLLFASFRSRPLLFASFRSRPLLFFARGRCFCFFSREAVACCFFSREAVAFASSRAR